jgi:PEGA domain
MPGSPAAQNGGSLVASSSPAGAEVYLDNQFRGVTPVTIYNVPAGNHIVNMRLDGYADWSGSADVTAGQVVQLAASLTTRSAASPSPTRAVLLPAIVTVAIAAGIIARAGRRRI